MSDLLRLRNLWPPLALLDEAALECVAAAAHIHYVYAGERIVSRGDTGRSVYWLLDGSSFAALCDRGSMRVLETHQPGDFFGEIAALTRVPRQVDVIAERATTLLELPYPALGELFEQPQARGMLIARLLERYQRLRKL